jgi:hypothetical protein
VKSDATVRLAVARAVLLGAFVMGLGTTWDVSWHARIGRDSFWIAPHVVVYTGTLLVLLATGLGLAAELLRHRSGNSLEAAARRVPRGLWMIAGGALWFVASAPFDDLWHRLFGLDVTIWSPPHLSLIAAAFTLLLGTLLLVRDEQERLDESEPHRSRGKRLLEWGLIGLGLGFLVQTAALALLPAVRYSYGQPGAGTEPWIRAFAQATGAWMLPLLVVALAPAVLFLAPPVLRLPFGVCIPALVHLALRPLGAAFAEAGYALVFPSGLPPLAPFAGVTGESVTVWLSFAPIFLVMPALGADLALLLARRWDDRWILAAVLFAVVVALQGAYAPTLFDRPPLPLSTLTVAIPILAVLALASAWLGRRAGERIVERGFSE